MNARNFLSSDTFVHIAYIAVMRDYPGEFEQMVLLAVLRLDADAYAVPVRAEIESCTGRTVARGALYTALERLDAKGLVRSKAGDPLPERGGRARRYFTVTPRGLAALRVANSAMDSLRQGLESLLEKPR